MIEPLKTKANAKKNIVAHLNAVDIREAYVQDDSTTMPTIFLVTSLGNTFYGIGIKPEKPYQPK